MTELCEGYNPPEIEKAPEDPKDKDPLTIRIILMCDGTNNNQTNIGEREKFEAGKKEEESDAHKKFGTVGSSYDNGRTNIATMEPHVESGANIGGYDYVAAVYVQGQGTFNFKKDSNVGLGFGSLSSGVYNRAREGVREALSILADDLFGVKKPSKYFIKQVDVDVFGFSRGAATARHAIHVLTEEEVVTVPDPSGYGATTVFINTPLFERLRTSHGYSEMTKDKVNIIFAGLYDTVVSVNASQMMPAWIANNTLSQRAVAKAKFALHLAAADEHRQDFPLHRITSSTSAGKGAEYFFPGVHSDIGGSYNLANEVLLEEGKEKEDARIRELRGEGSYNDMMEQKQEWEELGYDAEVEVTAWMNMRGGNRRKTKGRLFVYRNIDGLEYARPTSEKNLVINRGTIADLKVDMANLKKDGWYRQGEITIDTDYLASTVRTIRFIVDPIGAYKDGSPKSGKLIVSRDSIGTGYCTIPLKFMVEHSRKHAIKIDAKLDRRIKIILDSVPEFSDVEQALRQYMSQKGKTGSKPSDWNDIGTAEKIYPGIKKLRNRQLHMSSAFKYPIIDPGFTPRFEGNLRRRFYYEG